MQDVPHPLEIDAVPLAEFEELHCMLSVLREARMWALNSCSWHVP